MPEEITSTVLTEEDINIFKAFIKTYNARMIILENRVQSEQTELGKDYVESRLLCSILARVKTITDKQNTHTRQKEIEAITESRNRAKAGLDALPPQPSGFWEGYWRGKIELCDALIYWI